MHISNDSVLLHDKVVWLYVYVRCYDCVFCELFRIEGRMSRAASLKRYEIMHCAKQSFCWEAASDGAGLLRSSPRA